MTERNPETSGEEKLLRTERRDWQFWSLLVLGLALLGLGFAIYELLISPPQACDRSRTPGPLRLHL